jgi:cytochrome b involved in lipid metabolism
MLASTLARRSRLVSKACLQPKFSSAVAVGGYQQQEGRGHESVNFAAKLSLALIFTTGVCFAEAKKSASASTVDASGKKWPVISRDEVRKHDSLNNGIWVTYRNGVYDLTKFVHNHPGGRERLEGIAGQDIGDAWNLFRNHKGSALATDLLERMKIGELASHEVVNVPDPTYKPKYSSDTIYDVIIVGAGLSGLQCGSALVNAHGVDKSKILVLEAQDYVGGRVKQMTDFIRGTKIEVGAEFLHGTCLMDVCISFYCGFLPCRHLLCRQQHGAHQVCPRQQRTASRDILLGSRYGFIQPDFIAADLHTMEIYLQCHHGYIFVLGYCGS